MPENTSFKGGYRVDRALNRHILDYTTYPDVMSLDKAILILFNEINQYIYLKKEYDTVDVSTFLPIIIH